MLMRHFKNNRHKHSELTCLSFTVTRLSHNYSVFSFQILGCCCCPFKSRQATASQQILGNCVTYWTSKTNESTSIFFILYIFKSRDSLIIWNSSLHFASFRSTSMLQAYNSKHREIMVLNSVFGKKTTLTQLRKLWCVGQMVTYINQWCESCKLFIKMETEIKRKKQTNSFSSSSLGMVFSEPISAGLEFAPLATWLHELFAHVSSCTDWHLLMCICPALFIPLIYNVWLLWFLA